MLHYLDIMGCVKSKKSNPTHNANSVEKVPDGGKPKADGKPVLVHSETVGSAEKEEDQDPARVDPVLLAYAQRLSEEIVARAVQQWMEVDSRYSDIPYIECDAP